MQYLFNIHCLIVCLTINYFNRMKPVREGERHSRRKLGLSPEFKAEDLPVRTRHPKVLIQARGISTGTSRGYDPLPTTGFAELFGVKLILSRVAKSVKSH